MTLDGTNTYLLAEDGADEVVVVDPGPDDPRHRRRLLDAVHTQGRRAGVVLLTHGHPDHAAGAAAFAGQARCDVLAMDPDQCIGDGRLAGGDRLDIAGLHIEVVSTPGHTSDSVSLLLPDEPALLTGDTLLGRGSTVVAHPDGRLSAYLETLGRLARLAAQRPGLRLLPGHGPAGAAVADVVAQYQAHRVQRLDEVLTAVREGARTVEDVVAAVYASVDRALWPAAALSVRAQADYLVDAGQMSRRPDGALSVPGV
jgi:glyoxylase-like metal-dependent hydrolase (beta-lactamase superfamily II)